MRISRHPQLWCQLLWCIVHTAWSGTILSLIASCGLVPHHLLGVWSRNRSRFIEEWLQYSKRTSINPFDAIIDSRQRFEFGEFVTPAYFGVTGFTFGSYLSHPFILRFICSSNWETYLTISRGTKQGGRFCPGDNAQYVTSNHPVCELLCVFRSLCQRSAPRHYEAPQLWNRHHSFRSTFRKPKTRVYPV